jgi:hypothetical protein
MRFSGKSVYNSKTSTLGGKFREKHPYQDYEIIY